MKNFYPIFDFKKIPVYAHFSYFILLGLAIFILFKDFNFGTRLISWAIILPIHEIGHLLLCRQQNTPIHYITLHIFHGQCVYQLPETLYEESVIAWGGVLMQLGILPIPLLALFLTSSSLFENVCTIFLQTNFIIIFFNLIPLPGFDGSKCWHFFPLVFKYGFRKSNKKKKTDKKNIPSHIKILK